MLDGTWLESTWYLEIHFGTLVLEMSHEPFLKRLKIRNYKSIGSCDIELGRLTLLVGRNGSGKSNCLDALRFVVEGLQTSLDHAIKSRGGIHEVRHRSTGNPHKFGVEVVLNLPGGTRVATYGFERGAMNLGGFTVRRESLDIVDASRNPVASFHLENGRIISAIAFGSRDGQEGQPTGQAADATTITMPPAVSDRLYLVTAAGLPHFRAVYDALLAMGFYNLNPELMKQVPHPDAGELLRRDGSNIASVIARLSEDRPELKQRIQEYLQAIIPNIVEFERVDLGSFEVLRFRQEVEGANHPFRFFAESMSDGTLRSLGILVAALQLVDRTNPVRLVGIEEPETALHPAAVGVLMDALREAAAHTQILVTTHSPDLLDHFDPDTDDLLVVQASQGKTEIGPADAVSVESIRNHLFSAGELLRMDQLQPDQNALTRQAKLVFASNEEKP